MLTKLFDNKNNDALASLKNPFMSDKINSIRFYIYPKRSNNKWTGAIEFINGDTEGKHSFQHEDFPILVKKVEDFIKAL